MRVSKLVNWVLEFPSFFNRMRVFHFSPLGCVSQTVLKLLFLSKFKCAMDAGVLVLNMEIYLCRLSKEVVMGSQQISGVLGVQFWRC